MIQIVPVSSFRTLLTSSRLSTTGTRIGTRHRVEPAQFNAEHLYTAVR